MFEHIINRFDHLITINLKARRFDAVDALLRERIDYLRLAVRAEG